MSLHLRLNTLIIAALLIPPAVTANSEFRLTIEDNSVAGLPIYIAVYEAEAGDWEAEPVHTIKETLPETSEFTLALPVPAGRYAIRAFVDQDDNGELTTNDRGRPHEPFANSVGDGRSRSSHHFKHAIFTLSAENPETSLTLRHPKGSRDN